MMLLTEWIWRYHAFTHAAIPSFLNSLVHVVMYTYYAMSAINIPCSWKKYLTQFQMTQFVLLILHGVYGMITTDEGIFTIYAFYEFTLLLLFLSFYIKSYIQGQRKPKKTD